MEENCFGDNLVLVISASDFARGVHPDILPDLVGIKCFLILPRRVYCVGGVFFVWRSNILVRKRAFCI